MRDFNNAIERVVAGCRKRTRCCPTRSGGAWPITNSAMRSWDYRCPARRGAQGLDHTALGRRARLHDPAAHGRPLPDDAAGASGQDVRAAGRPRCGTCLFRRYLNWRRGRLQKVTDIARSVVTQYGMTEHLGQITYEKQQQSVGGLPLPGQSAEELFRRDCARDRHHSAWAGRRSIRTQCSIFWSGISDNLDRSSKGAPQTGNDERRRVADVF